MREAAALGFTEPDPRDDLNGLDVARKGLIIARQLGAKLELSDVALEGMATPELLAVSDREMFLRRIEELDEPMASRARMAAAKGNVLRFLAEITASAVSVGLREVPLDSPTGQLTGPDNILIFETDRYREQPLIIRGPGAGAEVTAAGVLGDILKIVRAS